MPMFTHTESTTPAAPSFSLKETAAVAAVVIQLVLGAVAYGRLDQAVTTLREDVREIRNVLLAGTAAKK